MYSRRVQNRIYSSDCDRRTLVNPGTKVCPKYTLGEYETNQQIAGRVHSNDGENGNGEKGAGERLKEKIFSLGEWGQPRVALPFSGQLGIVEDAGGERHKISHLLFMAAISISVSCSEKFDAGLFLSSGRHQSQTWSHLKLNQLHKQLMNREHSIQPG